MADKKQPRKVKKTETVRERAGREQQPKQPRRLKRVVSKPVETAKKAKRKEYYLPLPDNKVGRFLNKRRSFVPKYFRNAWTEVRQVAWPDRRTTAKLTFAVVMFAVVFGVLIAITDYGLGKLFKEVLLG